MSLASGNFLPTSRTCGHRLSYAVGAPRSEDVGAVFFFFKCKYQRMRVDQSLRGEKFASSFGYSLASVDFNGDGLKDLVVGAPFYASQGAAYIFMNTKDKGIHADYSPQFKLLGKASEGRFGFSMSHAGDLNNDGYDDVVIGAPYDGNGKVFVYLGGEEFNPEVPDQVLVAEDLPSVGIKTFGYSLGGGYDLDLNNHSDITVGAFGSDMAFVVRSRPVIDIATYFKERRTNTINPTLTGCETNPYSKEFCFTIESCFLIKNFPHNIASIHLRYSLNAEVFPGGRRVSRIRFGDANSNSSHISEKTVVVERNKLTGCFHETAYLKEGTADLRTPVMFQLKLKLQQDEPRPQIRSQSVSNINYFPILNQQQATKLLKVKFLESCGLDELCNSNLRASLTLGPGFDGSASSLEIQYRQEIQLNVSVSNTGGEPAYSAELQVNIDPTFAYVGRSDDVSDIHCDFRGVGLGVVCRLGNPYPSNRTDVLLFRVVPSHSSPFVKPEATFTVVTNTSSEDLGSDLDRTHQLQVKVIKRAEMSMRSLLQPDQIWYGGLVRAESAMRIMSDIGSKLTHTFQVTNDGPWHVEDFNVLIEWPHRLVTSTHPQGKRLLYLTEAPEVTPPGLGECFVNPKYINALGLRDAVRRPQLYTNRRPPRPYNPYNNKNDKLVIQRRKKKRKRRSVYQESSHSVTVNNNVIMKENTWTKVVAASTQYTTSSSSSFSSYSEGGVNGVKGIPRPPQQPHFEAIAAADIVLDCSDDQIVKCHIFTCRIHGGLRANESAVVRLRSRVWNSTLVEEFGLAASTVAIHAKAHLELPEELEIDQSNLMDDTTVATLVAFPDASVLGEGVGLEAVPTWIIVVSVLVGVVVVSLIAGTLYKLGFFRRNRVPEDVMISGKMTSNGNGGHASLMDDYIS